MMNFENTIDISVKSEEKEIAKKKKNKSKKTGGERNGAETPSDICMKDTKRICEQKIKGEGREG